MTRTTLLLLGITFFAGCATEGEFINENTPNACDSTGYTFVLIHYGDGRIITLPIIEVAAGAELQYHLMPGPDSALIDYSAATVTIEPKTTPVPPFPAPPGDAAWLFATGNVDDDGNVWSVCVPENPAGTQYYYTITIDGVGSLDPRADVEL